MQARNTLVARYTDSTIGQHHGTSQPHSMLQGPHCITTPQHVARPALHGVLLSCMPATDLRSCAGTAGAGSGSLRLLRSLFAFLWCFLCFLLRRLPSSAVSASCTSSPTAAMHSSLRREEVEQKFEHHQLPLPPVFLLLLQQSTAAGDDARSSNRSKHGLFVRLILSMHCLQAGWSDQPRCTAHPLCCAAACCQPLHQPRDRLVTGLRVCCILVSSLLPDYCCMTPITTGGDEATCQAPVLVR